MKINALVISLLGLLYQTSIAQVGIGTTTPDASAKLQIDATDKGFLPPRVALTSLIDQSTIATPAEGLLVYCTGTAGLAEGYYYWEGSTWVRMSNSTNTLDMGYVVGWPSNATPPGYLLPLSGGTYNWADYPEFQTFNGTYASQFITASTATTFTLKNINSGGRFLRGSTTAGTDQDDATSLPTTAFTAATAGAHVHSVDPPNTTSSTDGSHNHTLHRRYNSDNGAYDPNDARAYEGSAATTDRSIIYNAVPTSTNGAHSHTTDIGAFNSASAGDHSHSITGGDAETRPINTSVVWCLKVKPTATTANLTINNITNGVTTASNGLAISSNNVKLGGTLSETTTINKNGNNLVLSGSGNVVITGNVTATGTIRSAAAGQVLNMAMLPHNAGATTTINSSSFTNVAQITYTPVSSNSYILVEYVTEYLIGGYGPDSFRSEMKVDNTQISRGFQSYENGVGGGSRSGTLFPLMGRYENNSTNTLTITVNARRDVADDVFYVYNNVGSWFKITEIAR